jgi:hypothetical protein
LRGKPVRVSIVHVDFIYELLPSNRMLFEHVSGLLESLPNLTA